MSQTLTAKDSFLSEFQRRQSLQAGEPLGWLAPVRREAMGRFEKFGFPTLRDEDWRQTNVALLTQIPFQCTQPTPQIGTIPAEFLMEELGGVRLVFVNGQFTADLSDLTKIPNQITILPLSVAIQKDGTAVQTHLAKSASHEQPFVALNTGLFEDGVFIHVPKMQVVELPIHLLFLNASTGTPTVTHPRVLIVAEDESQVKVVETHAALGEGVHFTNAVTEIFAGESSIVRHLKVQRESANAFHVATLGLELARACNFTAQVINLGAALTRNDLRAVLDGEAIECNLHGLTLADGKRHVDNHTRIDHAKPHCFSRQFYKAVLDDRATSVFTGRIHVHPDAQKTDAIQSNRSLLLADTATAHAQPQLEIFADDVRCTHGATIGNLDEDAIFYLQSRGISKEESRGLLTYAFANEIIERIEIEPLRDRLERLIYDRFEGEFHPGERSE